MGAENVGIVLARWMHLPDPAFRCLILIAQTIHDKDQNPTWFGGREALAHVLGKAVPPDPGHERGCKCGVCKRRRASFEAVRLATEEHTKAVAMTLVVRPRTKVRAEYRVTALLQAKPVSELQAKPVVQVQGGPVAEVQVSPVPKEQLEEELRNTRRGPTSPQATNSPATPDEYAKASKILAQLPDLGATYLAQVEHLDTLTEQVIEAARLARTAPVPSRGGPPAR